MSLRFKGDAPPKAKKRKADGPAEEGDDPATKALAARLALKKKEEVERVELRTAMSFMSSDQKKAAETLLGEMQASASIELKKDPRVSKLQRKGVDVDPISVYGDLYAKRAAPKVEGSEYEQMVSRRTKLKSDRYCKGGIVG